MSPGAPFVDINGNGFLEPLDILLVINAISGEEFV